MTTRDSAAARALWDERYSTEGYVFGIEPNLFVAEQLASLPPGRALDLGSGQGRNAIWLAARGHRVTAVDLSSVATEQARRLAAEAGVSAEFLTADLTTWKPQPGAYDLVLLSYLQLAPEPRRAVHATAVDALAPGGLVFLVAHHRDNLDHGVGGPQRPELLFTEEDLAADFSGVTIERLERVVRVVAAGDTPNHALDVVLVGRRPGVSPSS